MQAEIQAKRITAATITEAGHGTVHINHNVNQCAVTPLPGWGKKKQIVQKKRMIAKWKKKSKKTEGEGGRARLRGLTVSLKWSLCLLWTARAKCWSLGWGRRFSSSKMSRTPTSFASTKSGNNNLYPNQLLCEFIFIQVQVYIIWREVQVLS